MASYVKANNTAQAWNAVANWTAGSGSPSSASDDAQWTNIVTGTTGTTLVATTVGKITSTTPTGTQVLSPGTGTLTIDPSSFGGIGVELTSAGTSQFTINGPIALGSSQEWKVASGRTLVSSSTITGSAKNLTLSDTGTKSFSGANTGWTNSTVTISGGIANATAVNALGAASNAIIVSSGANLSTTVAIAQTAISLSGTGISGGAAYGALYTTSALAGTNVITATTDGTVFSLDTASFAGKIATSGSVTTITINIVGAGGTTFTAGTSNYNASGGVRLQSYTTTGGAGTAIYSFGTAVGATDAYTSAGSGFGANANAVIVESIGCIGYYNSTTSNAAQLSRSYTFNGSATLRYQMNTLSLNFLSSVFLSGSGTTVGIFPNNATATQPKVTFSGTVSGNADLLNTTANASGTIGIAFAPGVNVTGYTGTLRTRWVSYGTTELSTITCPVVYSNNPAIDGINPAGAFTNHSAHSSATNTMSFNASGGSYPLTMSGGAWTTTPGTWTVTSSTLTLNFSFTTTSGTFAKAGAGTLALGGTNSAITALTWSAGNLTLNNAGAIGTTGTDTFTVTSAGVLDNTSGAAITLSKSSGASALNANFTWKGTAGLTFGAGNVTTTADRTITFAATGETGTLKFGGGITTATNTLNWNFGGATASAKQRVTLGGANASLSDATATNQHAVTAGYFRIENNNGLGAAATTTTWWVGATNLGSQTTKAALELAGVTTPDTKNVNLYNIGPNDDGALIGASGTSVFSGSIAVPNVAGTRIGVKSGATLTLLGSGIYPNLNPVNASTPLSFTAESGGTLNQNRVLGANTGAVAVTGGSGTVVFSRANLHTGAMTCSAGTTKVTDVNATSTGSVLVSAGATLESTVQSQFQSTLSLGTLSSPTRAILKFAA